MKYLSAALRQLRARKNIYQKELAAYLHTSIGTVSNYEAGIHEPDLATLVKIAEYYDVSIDFLLGRTVCPTFTDMGKLSISDTYTVSHFLQLLPSLTDKDKACLVYALQLLQKYREAFPETL